MKDAAESAIVLGKNPEPASILLQDRHIQSQHVLNLISRRVDVNALQCQLYCHRVYRVAGNQAYQQKYYEGDEKEGWVWLIVIV